MLWKSNYVSLKCLPEVPFASTLPQSESTFISSSMNKLRSGVGASQNSLWWTTWLLFLSFHSIVNQYFCKNIKILDKRRKIYKDVEKISPQFLSLDATGLKLFLLRFLKYLLSISALLLPKTSSRNFADSHQSGDQALSSRLRGSA